MRETFLVIPVHDRQELLRDLLDALDWEPHHIILIDNNSSRPLVKDFYHQARITMHKNRNIQQMWNLGWEIASVNNFGEYAVAFLNSDAAASPGGLERMVEALDSENASVVGTDHCKILRPGEILRKTTPGPVEWAHRMSGWGFVVRGELETRFDETLVWWYGDDDFEWRARQEFGGSVVLGGAQIGNRDPNGAQRDFPELNAQCDEDRINFINKWGVASQDWTIFNKEVYNARFGTRERSFR